MTDQQLQDLVSTFKKEMDESISLLKNDIAKMGEGISLLKNDIARINSKLEMLNNFPEVKPRERQYHKAAAYNSVSGVKYR